MIFIRHRKSLVFSLGLGIFLLLLFSGPKPGLASGEVRNVILIVGNGLELAHEIAASRYLYGRDYGLAVQDLPYQTFVSTWDVTTYDLYAGEAGQRSFRFGDINPHLGYAPRRGGQVPYPAAWLAPSTEEAYFLRRRYRNLKPAATDSAAAATALATGRKTDAGNLSWRLGDPARGQLETIAEKMRREKGAAIGVVSTLPFNYAFPAAFVAHNTSRLNYSPALKEQGFSGATIAEEIILQVRPEVIIGGGHPNWRAGYVDASLLGSIRNRYQLVERQAGQEGGNALLRAADEAAASGGKLFGLFGGRGGNLESPRALNTPGRPTIRQGSAENPTLAQMARAALRVLSRNEDGFFLLVEQGDLDWANGGHDFAAMIGCVWDFEQAVKDVRAFVNRPDNVLDWSNTLLVVTSGHATGFMRLHRVLGRGRLPSQIATGLDISGNTVWAYPNGQVSYATSHPTNELVSLYASGGSSPLFHELEGSWYPGTRIIDNTQVFEVMRRAAGVSRN